LTNHRIQEEFEVVSVMRVQDLRMCAGVPSPGEDHMGQACDFQLPSEKSVFKQNRDLGLKSARQNLRKNRIM
jgi:hypothetical protein